MSAAVAALRSGLGLGSRGARARTRAGSPPIEHSVLLTATLCLLAIGVVMVFSASSTTSLLGEVGDGTYYLKRTVIFGALGLLVLRLLSTRGLGAIRALTPLLLVVVLAMLVLTLLPGFGSAAGGAQRWLEAGPVQVQPSELAKLVLILYGAHLLAARPKMVADLRSMAPYLVVVAAACLLIVAEPDLGSALIVALVVAAVLIAAGAKLRHLALLAGALALLALVAIMIEPYRQERVFGFLNPGVDSAGGGFQANQAMIALGSGGIFGVGLGESVQKAFYLPEAHTDMIAAVIGEEVGLIGITVLVGLYMMFGYAGFRIAQRARDRYGRLLAAGLTAMVMIQATVNLFAVMGLAPLTGVTLPFVSYGNSSLIVTLAAVGLLLNISAGGTAPQRGGPAAARRTSRRSPRPRVGSGSKAGPGRSRPRVARSAKRASSGGGRATGSDRRRRDGRARGARARRRRRA